MAYLSKLAYCSGGEGTPLSTQRICGPDGLCKGTGLHIREENVQWLSLADLGVNDSIVALVVRFGIKPDSGATQPPGCAVSIRGKWTTSNEDRCTNQSDPVPLSGPEGEGCEGCLVHEGIEAMWNVLKPELIRKLEGMGCSKAHPLYLTGHSMGGGLSMRGMLGMKTSGWNVWPSYNFASLRVFDAASVKHFSKVLTGSEGGAAVTRVIFGLDQTPTWPWHQYPNGSDIYSQTYPEVHYTWNDEQTGFSKYVSMHENDGDPNPITIAAHSEGKLVKITDSLDHLTTPVAPAYNLVWFSDPVATCNLGAGNLLTLGIGDSDAEKWVTSTAYQYYKFYQNKTSADLLKLSWEYLATLGQQKEKSKIDGTPFCDGFDNPPSAPFYWETECKMGMVGCNADGKHVECRFCDHDGVACPRSGVWGRQTARRCTFADEPGTPYFFDETCQVGQPGCLADDVHVECRFCGEGDYASIQCP